ncbi:MAG: type II toxin-antitoxin system RelB/DinJ family antitoxin [Bacillota bacterium]|nr:type II toxin-antitoxin system RelB/DinJ family antitoxin [Bacillota bacterium]
MATKTANVIARVAPDVKTQAESIMDQLGVPVSVVINMLYKQIILTQSIPFSISIPNEPVALDEMDRQAFDSMMDKGYQQAINGETSRVAEAFDGIRKKL